jgi:DNA-directed RNA polymerase specialized sigma24 family protein
MARWRWLSQGGAQPAVADTGFPVRRGPEPGGSAAKPPARGGRHRGGGSHGSPGPHRPGRGVIWAPAWRAAWWPAVRPGRPTGAGGRAGRRARTISDAGQAVTVLYRVHYRALTMLAALLAADASMAEEAVQAAFAATHGSWRRLQGTDKALAYLQQEVVRQARSCRAAHSSQPEREPGAFPNVRSDIPETDAFLVAALCALPARQREALVLRYYMGWPDARIADATGIRTRAVASLIEHGMALLQTAIGRREAGPWPPEL